MRIPNIACYFCFARHRLGTRLLTLIEAVEHRSKADQTGLSVLKSDKG
jgi:hypothetical protein